MDKPIREACIVALSGLSQTGSRVYANRDRPLPANHAPTLLISTPVERAERAGMGVTQYHRRIEVDVEICVQNAAVPDDMLSDIAAEIEAAMEAAMIPGGPLASVSHRVTYTGYRMTIEGAEQTRHLGRRVLSFEVLTRSAASASQTFIR